MTMSYALNLRKGLVAKAEIKSLFGAPERPGGAGKLEIARLLLRFPALIWTNCVLSSD
ncbi:MAG TPA: hypothetical protein VIC26_04540 [Marinagarivorans sp.]